MPYNWNGDYIPSKADRSTDILGQKEIGGVGQLIYHPSDTKTIYLPMTGKNTVLSRYVSPDMNLPSLPMIPCPAKASLSACAILPDR